MAHVIYTLHTLTENDLDRLHEVIEEMRVLGAPTIRMVDKGDHYQALEGTHRLAAAEHLGLAPNLEIISEGEMVVLDSLDIQFAEPWKIFHEDEHGDMVCEALELAWELSNIGCDTYAIDDDGTIRNSFDHCRLLPLPTRVA